MLDYRVCDANILMLLPMLTSRDKPFRANFGNFIMQQKHCHMHRRQGAGHFSPCNNMELNSMTAVHMLIGVLIRTHQRRFD